MTFAENVKNLKIFGFSRNDNIPTNINQDIGSVPSVPTVAHRVPGTTDVSSGITTVIAGHN